MPLEIKHAATEPTTVGSDEFFTGHVEVASLFSASAPSRLTCACVTFGARARSAWHTHPCGQTLIVTSGRGFVQAWGGPVREIKPGDVIWTPPGEKHWHGAAPDSKMTHIAIQEALDGKAVDWLEKVSEEQYERAGP
jgi:quercetin dioxygenase-like cupin family protein